jgi:biopolymer transport protein ExbD
VSIIKEEPRGNDGTFRPQLTSLIDVMTILLVFLIKSFSVEGNIVTPSDDLVLPLSSSEKPPQLRTSIDITRNAVLADGEELTTLSEIAGSDSLLIASLYSWMQMQRRQYRDSLQIPAVMIQCDREVEFSYVKKVMFTCSKAGFIHYSVLVMQEE